MANVDNEHTPGTARGSAGTLDREGRGERNDRSTLKVLPRDDDGQMDPGDYAALLEVYDSSFRNIAEGEVVKGTTLLSLISVPEFFVAIKEAAAREYIFFSFYLFAMLVYFVVIYGIELFGRYLEAKFDKY